MRGFRCFLLQCFLALACGWCAGGSTQAQYPYQFTTYTTAQGLSDNRVTCIYKDRTGYVWVGTENGLNRFDGHRFLVYKPGGSSKKISHAYINSIQQDQDNRLWVATQNGLNLVDPAADTTLVFLPGSGKEKDRRFRKSIPSNLIWDVFVDPYNRIWIAPDSRDLCYYDIRKKEFISFPWLKFLYEQFPERAGAYNSIRKIYRKSDHEIWLGTSAGLFSMRTDSGSFVYHPSLPSDHFVQLYWNESQQSAWFVQDPGNQLQAINANPPGKISIPFANIPGFTGNRDSTKKIWLPAGNKLLQVHTNSRQVFSIAHETDNAASLPVGNMRIVYQDSTGVVWVGSTAGLSKFNSRQNLFQYVAVHNGLQQETPSEKDLFRTDHLVHTVLYNQQQHCYYISSPSKNQFIVLDAATGNKQVYANINGFPLKNCSVLHRDEKGQIWIFANQRAFIYDPSSGKFFNTAFRCAGSIVTDVAVDSSGNFWVASFNDGVYKFLPSQQSTVRLREAPGHLSDLPTSLQYDNASGTLWIGTFSTGLCAYDSTTEKFRYFIQSELPGEIGVSLVTDIVKDRSGKLWISSYAGGLVVYDAPGSKTFRPLTTEQNLPDNNVYSLIVGSDGKIWGTTYNGLFSVDPVTEAVTTYDSDKGLGFADFHGPLTMRDNGTIFTGVGQGFLSFNSSGMGLVSDDFTIVVNQVTTPKGESRWKTGATPTVHMSYPDDDLTIDVAALSYAAPHLTRYHYILEGLDRQWQSGSQANIRYTHIPPGAYTFRIRAQDYAGRWSQNECRLQLTVMPPWWKTGWFQALMVAAILGAAAFIFQGRLRAIRRKAAVDMEIQELKEKALRSQMNPHFIFNSLSAIQELVVVENHEAAYQYLSKFSKLLRMVLHASEKDLIPLSDELAIIKLYLELESLRFKHSFSYLLETDPQADIETILFPPMLLQPFIENAIWHGLRPTTGQKILSIVFSIKESHMQCTITDNGIGREEAAKIKSARIDSAHLSSKGIELAKQRLASLKTAAGIEGSITITDLKDAVGKSSGTSVTISIENISV